ncbi:MULTISPECIES: hypothetical protein [unclassified Brevundimonas]|nr:MULTISPECIES: hypothetical protein [unclassified Brevundimonas]
MAHPLERSSTRGLTLALTLLTAAASAGQVYLIAKGVIALF